MKQVICLALAGLFFSTAQAQTSDRRRELVVLAGLVQPFILQGGNVEVDYYTRRMVFNYSHGFSLDLDRAHGTTVGEARAQALALHLPYSTGFGIGYRLSKYVDIRLEPKLHRFDVSYDATDQTSTTSRLVSYNTVTVGVGAYFRWKPFEKRANALNGLFTSTSLRYWPNVWSSLDNNQFTYQNRVTGKTEVHRVANIGFANTPVLFNIAVGYSVSF